MNAPVDIVSVRSETLDVLARLGVDPAALSGGTLAATSPITGETLADLAETTPDAAIAAIDRAHETFLAWRKVPAPRRGELIRLFRRGAARRPRPTSAAWSPWKPARSSPRAWARCRR